MRIRPPGCPAHAARGKRTHTCPKGFGDAIPDLVYSDRFQSARLIIEIPQIVLELVEGDDLSQRIAQGAIPLDEALPIAKQIAAVGLL